MSLKRWTGTWGIGVGVACLAVVAAVAEQPTKDWPMFGQSLANTASANETGITTGNVRRLGVKWSVNTNGDVSARAAVVNGVAYVPDWGAYNPAHPTYTDSSMLWAVDIATGAVRWSHSLSNYGLQGSGTGQYHSRTTPAVSGGTLYLGTQEGSYLLAIDAATGRLKWGTRLEPTDPLSIVTTSPAVYNGLVYTGVASIAESGSLIGLTSMPAVRGSAVALNAVTGEIKWKTYTVPLGYSGGGVWGSNPVVDAARNAVLVGTGNNYRHPDSGAESSAAGVTYGACVAAGGSAATCNSPNDHVDSVLALDLTTGAIKWSRKLVDWNIPGVTNGSDDWNVDCFFAAPLCPTNPGPDFDFGSTPNLITYQSAHGPRTILGAGQKSGIYYAIDPDTGALLWQTQVGPGSSLGGMEWGSASDGRRIYVQITNLYGIPHLGGNGGSWSALDPATGQILWQTAEPSGSVALGPVTVANGVVYGSSMAGSPNAPTMLALDAATGNLLWSFASGASVNAGASIVNGTVIWGSGYSHLGIPGFTANNKLYAFSVNGK